MVWKVKSVFANLLYVCLERHSNKTIPLMVADSAIPTCDAVLHNLMYRCMCKLTESGNNIFLLWLSEQSSVSSSFVVYEDICISVYMEIDHFFIFRRFFSFYYYFFCLRCFINCAMYHVRVWNKVWFNQSSSVIGWVISVKCLAPE